MKDVLNWFFKSDCPLVTILLIAWGFGFGVYACYEGWTWVATLQFFLMCGNIWALLRA